VKKPALPSLKKAGRKCGFFSKTRFLREQTQGCEAFWKSLPKSKNINKKSYDPRFARLDEPTPEFVNFPIRKVFSPKRKAFAAISVISIFPRKA
jgi:hypothetical protein